MSALSADEFPAFFKAIHGHDPFSWQVRLLAEIARNGEWPRTLAAPTGAGKTAVLDVALFHLAMEAHRGGERRAPVRICFAVDRRIIVDQAFERAQDIKCALDRSQGLQRCDRDACVCKQDVERARKQADDPIVRRVAEAFKIFSGECSDASPNQHIPLHVEQLRGGMPREDDWARTPAQPTILCTTVDQLGSRLLFRGYGVSERMAPVHAGLLGEDCLILLDEAHLSAAFAETLDNVARWRVACDRTERSLPWRFCGLTATPRGNAKRRFELTAEEKGDKHIRLRLAAEKQCLLIDANVSAGSAEHGKLFVEHAKERVKLAGRPDPVVAIIVNRVPFARAIFEALAKENEAILLTGRVRPVERDALIARYRNRLFAGERENADKPLFVVATQCVEAGADFDFDALVTQIAPLDALRQRFGRLDRLGAKSPTRAVLIAAKDEVSKGAKDDPIYGARAKATWAWLSEHASPPAKKGEAPSLDFGPNAMQTLIAADSAGADDCVVAPKSVPILRGADLAFLSMTHPRPHPDPEISLFLHGELGRDTDVSIVWRADIEACFEDGEDDARSERLGDILDLVPPRPGEALRVPLWQARAWLRGDRVSGPLADVDAPAPPEERAPGVRALRVARRAGGEKSKWEFVEVAQIKAGDTLIAPSSHGGCDKFGWAPESKAGVVDVADEAAEPYEGRRAFLRLHEKVWRDETLTWTVLLERIHAGEPSADDLLQDASGRAARFRDHARKPREGCKFDIEWPYPEKAGAATGAILIARGGLAVAAAPGAETGAAVTDEGDAGSFMSRRLLLSVHRADVEAMVQGFARALGLSSRLANSVALAALLHDDGKADPRFQAFLAGGALADEPLAKSSRRPRGEDAAACSASRLPDRWRHEALSVRMAIECLAREPRGDIDEALVLWLVGTHHGYGRPFFPHDDDWDDHARVVDGVELSAAPGPQRLDFEWNGMDWVQLFEVLKRRYGVWGLAYLEAVVRLADHRASEMRERAP